MVERFGYLEFYQGKGKGLELGPQQVIISWREGNEGGVSITVATWVLKRLIVGKGIG